MKNYKFYSGLIALWLTIAVGIGQAAPHNPHVLKEVLEAVEETVEENKKPVVIFDLDDTLINTRERNYRIIRDFTSQPIVIKNFPAEVSKVTQLKIADIKYLLSDTLKVIGITNEQFVKEAGDYWAKTFFTNEYCRNDKPNNGAAKYANLLYRAGATVVYLTGRDVPRMEQGTRENLTELNFPLNDNQAKLMMKPTKEEDDLVFKKRVLGEIEKMGVVVAGFENEPANINAFQEQFKDGIMVFLDTIHSPKPIVPNPGISWVKDFVIR